jgi:hypothetical protein
MHYRYMPLFPHELARDAKVGIQLPVSGEEKRRRAVMAAAMLLVSFVSFGTMFGLYLIMAV